VIASSPCKRIKLPGQDQGEVEPLTLAQVKALEVGMGDLGVAVITLAGSGLRIGELLGLECTTWTSCAGRSGSSAKGRSPVS
jgi:hypothetical protein